MSPQEEFDSNCLNGKTSGHPVRGDSAGPEQLGDRGPGLCCRSGKLGGLALNSVELRRIRYEEVEARDGRQGPRKNTHELGQKLPAWVRSEQVAALEIVEEIGGRPGGGSRNACRHEVGGGGLGDEHSVGKLHELAHRAHRRDVGLTRGTTGDQGEQEGHGHRG